MYPSYTILKNNISYWDKLSFNEKNNCVSDKISQERHLWRQNASLKCGNHRWLHCSLMKTYARLQSSFSTKQRFTLWIPMIIFTVISAITVYWTFLQFSFFSDRIALKWWILLCWLFQLGNKSRETIISRLPCK